MDIAQLKKIQDAVQNGTVDFTPRGAVIKPRKEAAEKEELTKEGGEEHTKHQSEEKNTAQSLHENQHRNIRHEDNFKSFIEELEQEKIETDAEEKKELHSSQMYYTVSEMLRRQS
ncbi:MAG: hypothetical protein FWF50_01900 [Defluviitaleaceae bacterium]|nr:hypothetical protein [Defluviitaleaceae bacterium]